MNRIADREREKNGKNSKREWIHKTKLSVEYWFVQFLLRKSTAQRSQRLKWVQMKKKTHQITNEQKKKHQHQITTNVSNLG